jgi:DNA polymerase-3 subunit delta'
MAIELGKALNCLSPDKIPCHNCDNCRLFSQLMHPDLKFVFAAPAKLKEEDYIKHMKEKAQNYYLDSNYSGTAGILIDQIRELKKMASMKLYKGKSRVFIISEADRMTIEASNSLLKLLEEPPERLLLILTTARMDKLLPTIISRCQLIKFSPLDEESVRQQLVENGIETYRAKIVSRLSMGNFRKATALLEEDYQTLRDQAWTFLLVSQKDDELEKIDVASELSTKKDRSQIKELFLLMLLWMRDVQVYRENGKGSTDKSLLYNADQMEKVEQLHDIFTQIDIDKTITETENSIDLVDKNVYINLILINYLNYLFNLKT